MTALTLAQSERARLTQLLGQHLATRDQVAQAQKAVSDAQDNLDLLKSAGGGSAGQTLTAPFDGIISALPVATGARVAAQAPLATLDRANSLVIAVGVEPAQRDQVATGQPAASNRWTAAGSGTARCAPSAGCWTCRRGWCPSW